MIGVCVCDGDGGPWRRQSVTETVRGGRGP